VRRERHPIERRYVVDGAASGAVVMPEVHSLAISMIRSFPSISSAGSLIQGIVGCAFGLHWTGEPHDIDELIYIIACCPHFNRPCDDNKDDCPNEPAIR
jgi:hypothetical protein